MHGFTVLGSFDLADRYEFYFRTIPCRTKRSVSEEPMTPAAVLIVLKVGIMYCQGRSIVFTVLGGFDLTENSEYYFHSNQLRTKHSIS